MGDEEKAPEATAAEVGGEGEGDAKATGSKMRRSSMNLRSKTSHLSEVSSGSLAMRKTSEMDRIGKGPKYLNTYRLDPKIPFLRGAVENLLESIVELNCAGMEHYDTIMAAKIVITTASEVRKSVKALAFDRYKICVLVYMGEKKMHGYQAAVRCLWDQERDGYATYYFECRTYFMSVACFCLYHD